MKIIVAITGASGGIYARQCIEQLLSANQVEQIALVVSTTAREVLQYEGIELPISPKIVCYNNDDMFAAVASGSARYDAMVVVPASMGSVGRIASGVSLSLIERAADVMLKERRRLVVVVRETPYSLIHLRNMTTLTEAGAIVLPASPSFYSHAVTIEELAMTITERIIAHLGIELPHYEWGYTSE
ncbi:MAG: UbiX family flavin prenyltransferase [Alistipes sp.]|nr:UbiX family flavin prenyltransferase [Alistipes sp.]